MIAKVIEKCRVVMLTFGGKQVWDYEEDKFHYGSVYETNESYTVFGNGLNFYVFPTKSIQL